MYQTETQTREARTRRLLYLALGASILILVATCMALMVLMSAPTNVTRPIGRDTEYTVGEVYQEAIERLSITELMPGAPNWSEDIVYVIKQPDASYRAYLGIDPVTGCKINWQAASSRFVDSTCSQTQYSIAGRNESQAATLAGSPQHMVELMVNVEEGRVVIRDQIMRRDIQ